MAVTTLSYPEKQGGDITYEHMVDETEALGDSQIQKLFTGATVLLTGGTGFLGKLLVEKLLRSCPDLKRLYLLARPKKNKEITKRLQEQFDDVLYEKLRKERPNFMQKITLIEGDVGQLNLGISEEDRTKIINEVEFIFHGAATVKFDEALKTAVEINVRGTREILELARACTKLKAHVHVSTAYSNCTLREIDEKFYEIPLASEKLVDLVENMDEKTLNSITPGLLGDCPNTYAYTKAAAEDIVKKYAKGLPVALFRPSIVIGTAREPVAGWIDNVYGPTGVVVGAAVGLIHVLNCNPTAIADLVPGDMVVNACIATAWKTARDYPGNDEDAPPQDQLPAVYNYISSEQQPLTWANFMKYNEVYGLEVPSIQAVWFYLLYLTPSRFLYTVYCLFLHWIPAYVIDGIAILIGKKPMLRKAYRKIEKFSAVIGYFALREWKFHNKNTQALFKELCDADKHIFDFDMGSLDWSEYFLSYIRGQNSEVVISQSGVERVTPCGVGLKFYVELNNTSDDHDYEVQVSGDQCCLEADGSLDCDVLEIIGDCVGFVPRGSIKTVRMVAPILDPIDRHGYCILYLDSKCNYSGRNMRDTIKISFDTRLGNLNKILEANIKPCKNIDEDPLNDCQPVDCDSFYNNRKPYYSKTFKRCVETPSCISDMVSELPNVIYDPITNRCVVGKAITKRDVDYIKDLNAKNRRPKDVLIIKNYGKSSDINVTSNDLNNAIDMVPMCKKCNKLHILNPPLISHIKKECFPNFLSTYFVTNKYTVSVFAGVIIVQCCLIGAMIYCFTKSCACCKKKKVIRKFFNYRQDASVTTPLIGTSNMDTETDYQFESESSNVDNKIKCYKACQKERNKNMKMSMSDDILSKCLNRRNWSRHQNKTDVIPEVTNEIVKNIDKVETSKIPATESKKSETKVVFEDEKPKPSEKISKKIGSIPKCLNKEIIEREKEEIEEYGSSEKEIQCHSYNNNGSNITGFKPKSFRNLGYFQTERRFNVSVSSDKEAQAYFSNDSIDDLLSEKGIYFAENISKYNFSTDTNKTSTPVSSKTSKNFVKNVLSLLHRKSKTNTSDPGGKAENTDVKLIHMSRASIYTSTDSECVKCLKPKDTRTSL
ncbi:uncharacterized protein [Epargyreus clarus]|uniref:uncharacterized protein n=1 Tax=Epargyreus clarus TaxID=520877 RepID=UPI003C2F48ED